MFVVGAFEFGVIPGRKLSLTFGLNLTADKPKEGQCKNEIIFEIPWSHPGRSVEVKCPSLIFLSDNLLQITRGLVGREVLLIIVRHRLADLVPPLKFPECCKIILQICLGRYYEAEIQALIAESQFS